MLVSDNDNKHNIRRSTCLAHGWQRHIGENWHNRATTSGGEYSVTTEDGRVRPKHVLIEFNKWMCYIDGQKNKYSIFNIYTFVHQCNIHFLIFYYSSTCFGLTAIFRCYSILPRSWCSVMPTFFAYARVPAMCFCWWCAYCQWPCVRIFVLSLLS
jgi:hypothetical protein